MATAEEIQQLRELVAHEAAQLDAVATELRTELAATPQAKVRSGLLGRHGALDETARVWLRAGWQTTVVSVVLQCRRDVVRR